jgi:hypothetical protein
MKFYPVLRLNNGVAMKKKDKIKQLKIQVNWLKSHNDFLEQTLKSCENACIYHQERSEKAFEIIGRLMVDGELDAEEI